MKLSEKTRIFSCGIDCTCYCNFPLIITAALRGQPSNIDLFLCLFFTHLFAFYITGFLVCYKRGFRVYKKNLFFILATSGGEAAYRKTPFFSGVHDLSALIYVRRSFVASLLRLFALCTRRSSFCFVIVVAPAPIVTPIVSIIFNKGSLPSLNVHTAIFVANSTIFLPEKMCLGATCQMVELNDSLLFFVFAPKHRLSKSSDVRSS